VTTEERTAALETIASEVRVCDRCRLSEGRTNAVPGEGSADTEVVFVGEGPGQREDQKGVPFVGAAGGLLEELLGLIGWKREDVFITNVVKCRPPGNRDPEPDEIAACEPYLRRQLEILDPALLVTLGRFSLQTFMPGDRISRVHGTERPVDPATGARAATGYAMYHPAAALRQGSLKETMQRDMAAVPDALIRARQARSSAQPVDQETTVTATAETGAAAPLASAQPAAPAEDSIPTPTATTATTETPEDTTTVVPEDQLGLF
jgi:uracil-DNA glycosylase family 4